MSETSEVNEMHRAVVEAGGGVYRAGMMAHLVLFDSPQTRSTLALPESELTEAAVRYHIRVSNLKFGIAEEGSNV